MERSYLQYLKDFYNSPPGQNIAEKVAEYLKSKLIYGQVLMLGFGSRFLDGIPEAHLFYAIPEGYEISRWPRLRPFRTVVVNEEKLPFVPECFDVIVVVHVLEYEHRPDAFLKEISRILKKGGNLVIVSINKQCWNMNTRQVCHLLRDQLMLLNANNFCLQQICYINSLLRMYDRSHIFKYIFLRSIAFLFNITILDVTKKSDTPELIMNFQEKYGIA